jgi:2-amino-4-hydroxy-6-hydroxymethyldihydropteridine diphosphokinase
MFWAVLGLGTNLGARRAILEGAIALLGDRVLARSALYVTPPLGPPQPDYLNAAVRVRWDRPIEALLARVQELEASFERQRSVRWGPRTLDVDILYSSAGPVSTPALCVPHPELEQRSFALAPLLDVAPELASLAPRLAALGGAPARTSWSAIVREGSELCGDWLHDRDELAAQFVALSSLGAAPEKLGVRPFSGAVELLAGGELERVVSEARAQGFEPRTCAVLRRDTRETIGVLIGEPVVREAAAAASPRLEQRGDGAQRFVVPRPASSWR